MIKTATCPVIQSSQMFLSMSLQATHGIFDCEEFEMVATCITFDWLKYTMTACTYVTILVEMLFFET